MRSALYLDAGEDVATEELADEIDMMLAADDWAAFGAEADDGGLIGLIELFERNYAEGCATSPVTFVEGLWVAEAWRRKGVARMLIAAGAAWGRSRGRTELASDVRLVNERSQAVHERLGFEETGRLVTYRRSIDGD